MNRSIFSGTTGLGRRLFVLSALAIGIAVFSPLASASIMNGCALLPNTSKNMGSSCDASGASNTGSFVISQSQNFTISGGLSTGTLVSAVYREAGGTLDFYYQFTNNLTSTNCPSPAHVTCDPLSRETNTDFTGFLTFVASRVDGSSLTGGFVDSFNQPVIGDRTALGNTVGFGFTPPTTAKIAPGTSSAVLVVSTNAVNYTIGTAQVIDGGVANVAAFAPTAATPEPASLALVGLGLVALGGLRRRIQNRRSN